MFITFLFQIIFLLSIVFHSNQAQITKTTYVASTSTNLELSCMIDNKENNRWRWYHNRPEAGKAPSFENCLDISEVEQCQSDEGGVAFFANSTYTSIKFASISMDDAGRYNCLDDEAEANFFFEVIVVDSIKLTVHTNVTNGIIDLARGDAVEGKCQVSFNSSNPSLIFPTITAHPSLPDETTTRREDGRHLAEQTFVRNATESFVLLCAVRDEDNVVVVNLQSKEKVEVKPHYCPENLMITGHTARAMTSGSDLTCSVSAYPPVRVTWSNQGSVSGSNKATIKVTSKGDYTCVVMETKGEVKGSCGGIKESIKIVSVTSPPRDANSQSGKSSNVKSGTPPLQSTLNVMLTGCFLFKLSGWLR